MFANWRWTGPRALGAFLFALALATSILSVIVYEHNLTLTHCLARWADQTSNRNDALTLALSQRNDALDALIRSVPAARQHPQTFTLDLQAYIAASDHYKQVERTHPVPPPPALKCGA